MIILFPGNMANMGEPSKPSSELGKLREKCRDLVSQNERLMDSEIQLKKERKLLDNEVASLRKELNLKDSKLIRASAQGAINNTSSTVQEGLIKELTIKFEGAKEDCELAKKEASRYKLLYKEAQALYADQIRVGILKKDFPSQKKEVFNQIQSIMNPQEFIPPQSKRMIQEAQGLDDTISSVKSNIMSNLDRLGESHTKLALNIKKEPDLRLKTVELRQVFQTQPDGSLSLVSSTPVFKQEKMDYDIIELDSD